MARPRQTIKVAGDNRSRLLRIAADLFATRGYSPVSVRDLAGRLQLTTGAIYSNFNSKGDLLAEVLETRIREDMEHSRPELALPQFVRQSFVRMRERSTMRALLVEAAAAARTDAVLRERLNSTLDALLKRWIEDYKDWQKSRLVHRQIDMDALVRSLWSIELGLGVLDAQGGLRARPRHIAEFVGAYLDSLEMSGAPGVREARPPVSRSTRRRMEQPAAAGDAVTTRQLTPLAALRDSPGTVATQSQLIEIAGDLFATRGYSGVSVRDVARAASMTTGSIYGNFANKAILLVEVIEARIAEELEDMPSALVASGSPVELVEHNLRASDTRKQLRALLLEGAAAARSDSEVLTRLQELQRHHLGFWTDGLKDWVTRSGATPSVDLRTAITVVWSAELGLGLLEALELPTPPTSALADTFGSMFGVAGLDNPTVASRLRTSRGRGR